MFVVQDSRVITDETRKHNLMIKKMNTDVLLQHGDDSFISCLCEMNFVCIDSVQDKVVS